MRLLRLKWTWIAGLVAGANIGCEGDSPCQLTATCPHEDAGQVEPPPQPIEQAAPHDAPNPGSAEPAAEPSGDDRDESDPVPALTMLPLPPLPAASSTTPPSPSLDAGVSGEGGVDSIPEDPTEMDAAVNPTDAGSAPVGPPDPAELPTADAGGPCASGTYRSAEACAQCPPGNYCAGATNPPVACGPGTWDGGNTASPCIPHTECGTGTFAANVPDATTDRMCQPWTVCPDNQYVTGQPSATTDRQCTACIPGKSSTGPNATGCIDKVPTYTQIAAGDYHACGIRRDDRQVQCWGSDGAQQATPPAGVQFSVIDAGEYHTCGVRVADQKVQCWGDNSKGQAPPLSTNTYSTVSCGQSYCCALRLDGEADCWGGSAGQTGTEGIATPPPGVKFTQLSAGMTAVCGVRSDTSTALCWGGNNMSQSSPPASTQFSSVWMGGWFGCGLETDGKIDCWGSNMGWESEHPDGTFTSLSCGDTHSCALEASGEMTCWGGENIGSGVFVPPNGVKFSAVAVGLQFACGIRLDNALAECWAKYEESHIEPPSTWFE